MRMEERRLDMLMKFITGIPLRYYSHSEMKAKKCAYNTSSVYDKVLVIIWEIFIYEK